MGKRKLDQSYSIDISDNGPVTGLRQDPEVIDLADDSPPATSGTGQANRVLNKLVPCWQANLYMYRPVCSEDKPGHCCRSCH